MDLFTSTTLLTTPSFGALSPAVAVLLPALHGQHRLAGQRLAALEAATEPLARGPLYAHASRALLLAGRPGDARRALTAALDLGDATAAGLAPLLTGQPAPTETRGRPHDQADALCDHAAWCVLTGRRPAARSTAEAAAAICPGHAEAGRWLAHLPTPLPLPGDLLPRAELGWLSSCRLRRRVVGGLWSAPAPSDRPEGRRQALGLLTRVLGRRASVAAEATVDVLATHLRTHLPVGRAARVAWQAGRRQGPASTLRLARWLLRQPQGDPDLVVVQAAAAAVLRAVELDRPGPRRPPGAVQLTFRARPAAAAPRGAG